MDIKPSPRLAAFLEALRLAPDDDFVSPPGLSGTMRARFVRIGLETGVLNLHWSGTGLQYAVFTVGHGVCNECATAKTRSICTHCTCKSCRFDRQAEELGGKRVSQERVKALARQLQTFTFGCKVAATAFDVD